MDDPDYMPVVPYECEFCAAPLQPDRFLCDQSVCDACRTKAYVVLIPREAGEYIPQRFIEEWAQHFDGVTYADAEILLKGPGDSKLPDWSGRDPYWAAWERVLSSAYCALTGRTGWWLDLADGDLVLTHPDNDGPYE